MKIRLSQKLPVSVACGFLVLEMAGCGTNETLIIKQYIDGGAGRILGGGKDGSPKGSGGAAGSGPTGVVGKKCLDDSECPKGLICLEGTGNDFSPGGPANGICTLDCAADHTACAGADSDSICVQFPTGVNYCLPLCTPGAGSQIVQCQGRVDLACQPDRTNPGLGFCIPVCGGDVDCGTRKCDLGTGLCVDQLQGTLPIGSACDPNAATDPCAGACVGSSGLTDAETAKYGFCSGRCVLGDPRFGCGNDRSATKVDALCAFAVSSSAGPGDRGLCAQPCNCNGDCLNKALICSALDAQTKQDTGFAGVCDVPLDQNGAPVPGIPCKPTTGTGGGSAGGASGTGGTSGAGGSPVRDAGAD